MLIINGSDPLVCLGAKYSDTELILAGCDFATEIF